MEGLWIILAAVVIGAWLLVAAIGVVRDGGRPRRDEDGRDSSDDPAPPSPPTA